MTHNTMRFPLYCLAIIPFALPAIACGNERPVKPNIVLILTDDLG